MRQGQRASIKLKDFLAVKRLMANVMSNATLLIVPHLGILPAPAAHWGILSHQELERSAHGTAGGVTRKGQIQSPAAHCFRGNNSYRCCGWRVQHPDGRVLHPTIRHSLQPATCAVQRAIWCPSAAACRVVTNKMGKVVFEDAHPRKTEPPKTSRAQPQMLTYNIVQIQKNLRALQPATVSQPL